MGRSYSLGQSVIQTLRSAAVRAFPSRALATLIISTLVAWPGFAEEAGSPTQPLAGSVSSNAIAGKKVRRIAPGWISPDFNVLEFQRAPSRDPLSPLASPAARQVLHRQATAQSAAEDWVWRRMFRPQVIAAGSIRVGEYDILIEGVSAPKAGERCGASSRRCGTIARASVRRWVRARAITCLLPPEQKSGATASSEDRTVRTSCLLAGEDVATWLVANGWALPFEDEQQVGEDRHTAPSSERAGAVDLTALSEDARRKGLGLFGLGGWSPGDCEAARENCLAAAGRDPSENLPTPKWTYPVATILPSPDLTDDADLMEDISGTAVSTSAEAFQ
ncbi:thermonuclease family protein [Notoacmeibacter sp. MSK16QG-6]|uniref:thermonuclease family protein n=1 Tax=Notoacmeibacter sp. MSK16QG-6 TaxID=2957982 RepID=UPI00209CE0C6|nr:hypothetical protein [Notoacmeibacter sp. MSK16QG-6]MCP1198620.1 hypothetical protein [Notoacmeibacter sp. MSK16QG-6]